MVATNSHLTCMGVVTDGLRASMQAIEARGEAAKAALVKKGIDVAVTPEAAQKLVRAAYTHLEMAQLS